MSRLGDWLRGPKKPEPEALARLKDRVRLILGLPEDVAISANEIICADPSCPGFETVILVMAPGMKTIAYKVQGGIEAISDEALTAALVDDSRP